MDLAAVAIFILTFVICSLLVFFFSVYGTKEVSFEENLKASHEGQNKAKNKANSAAQNANNKKAEVKKTKANDERDGNVASANSKETVVKSDAPAEPVAPPEPVSPANVEEEEVKAEAVESREKAAAEVEAIKKAAVVTAATVKAPEAEPAAKKQARKKMPVEDVEPEPSRLSPEQPEQPEAAPGPAESANEKKPAKKAKKAKGGNGSSPESAKNASRDIIALAKKTPMDDVEVQQVIDILLNKQSGGVPAGASEWVEHNSDRSETKLLQRQLAEKESLLSEEVAKVKSITDRMNVLREELNSARSGNISSKRYIDELQAQHKHTSSTFEARLTAEREMHQRDLATLQGQIQYHASHAQSIQATLDQLQQQPPVVDPALYAELDQLRATKLNYDTELGALRNQLSLQQEETSQLQHRLTNITHLHDEAQVAKAKATQELGQAQEQAKTLSDRLNSVEGEKTSNSDNFKEKIEDLSRSKLELEAKLKDLTAKNQEQAKELSRTTEENERLSEQLAANVERPRADGQEDSVTKQNSDHKNGHKDGESGDWHEKFVAISQEHERTVKENDVILKKMSTKVSDFESKVVKLQTELEEQRAKNNSNNVNIEDLKKKATVEVERSQRDFLLRLFPDVGKIAENSHAVWMEKFADSVKKSSPVAQNGDVSEEEAEKLKGQVKHYKSVLNQTESMLNKLQASVESEEVLWKNRMSEKDSQIEAIQRELEAVLSKNEAMEVSLKGLNSAEEMESKLRELQEKLAFEEADKKQLQEQLHKNGPSNDLESLEQQLSTEKKLRADLDGQVARMSQLLATGQEALQQEQKTVEMLRQQLASSKSASPSSLPLGNGKQDDEVNVE